MSSCLSWIHIRCFWKPKQIWSHTSFRSKSYAYILDSPNKLTYVSHARNVTRGLRGRGIHCSFCKFYLSLWWPRFCLSPWWPWRFLPIHCTRVVWRVVWRCWKAYVWKVGDVSSICIQVNRVINVWRRDYVVDILAAIQIAGKRKYVSCRNRVKYWQAFDI